MSTYTAGMIRHSNPRHSSRSLILGAAIACVALLALPWLAVAQPASSFSIEHVLSAPFPSDLVVAARAQRVAWVFNACGVRNVWVADGPGFAESAHPVTRFTEDDGQAILSLRLTPDGRTAVFVRGSEANEAGEIPNPRSLTRELKQQLVAVDVDGKGGQRLLGEMGVDEEGAEDVQISPDGRRAVWAAKKQLWIAELDGRETAKPVPGIRGDCSQPKWSPDGRSIAFVSDRDDHSYIGVHVVGGSSVRYFDPSTHRDTLPRWSPDGKQIAFIRLPCEQRKQPIIPERPTPWSIRVADAASGAGRAIWVSGGKPDDSFPEMFADEAFHFAAGGRIVVASEQDGRTHLYSLPADGGAALLLTPGDFDVEDVALSADRTSVIYSSNQGDIDRRHIWRVPVAGGLPVPLTSGETIEWSPVETEGGRAVFCVASSATTPAQPSIIGAGHTRPIAASAVPADFPSKLLIEPQQVIFTSEDGVTVHGQLFVPRDPAPGRRPALVYVHGGPPRQMMLGFHYFAYYHNTYAMNQYMASRGYVVLSVNYRLGIMYGRGFREARDAGWRGSSEYRDVVAAGRFLAARPDVDPKRIGLWGGSYGGLLTALGLARDSGLFAAGVDLHGVHDWSAFLPTDVGEYFAEVGNGPIPDLADAMKLAYSSSPVASVRTWRSPVLLIHGDDDRNVPFAETVDLVARLSERHVPFEQIVLQDEIHDFLRHESWLRVCHATADFLDRSLMQSATVGGEGEGSMNDRMIRSFDGVPIAYTAAGSGPTSIVFIHGGFADRSFWSNQLASLRDRYRMAALDLGGHGGSGRNRVEWTLRAMGEDVRAVVEAESLQRVVLVGNSMGGQVAIEAARLMPDRVIAVIGVDAFQDISQRMDPKAWQERIDAFKKDLRGSCEEMTKQLFHADADPAFYQEVRDRMCKEADEEALSALAGLKGYDMQVAAKAVRAPIGCVNGDLFPVNLEGNRAIAPGFQAIVMPHMGHYPMLERPAEFDKKLEEMIERLTGKRER